MTSGAQSQSQPPPAFSPPPGPAHQAPTAPPTQSTSPPNKRDLKSWWKGFKLQPKHQESHESRPQGIFGVPLRQSITYANVAISLIDEQGKSYIYGYVPIVVAKCGVFLKEKATGIQGIFRLSGSEKRIKELKTIFDSPDRYGKGLVWDGYTVHDAANLLRRYLNDLPEPVVPLDLYDKFRYPLRGATKQAVGDAEGPQFVENFDMDAAISKYQQLITELPPLNRQLLLYILDLLAVFAAKSDENRMNSQNLAAIFQPGMLSHPAHAMAPEEYRLNQCVIIFLIENQDHFLIGMQGTAADEKTVREVQKGTPATVTTPATPISTKKSGVARSASNASAGAESVLREGKIRRNRSTSSRHSRQSNGGPSPGSPALATTPTGGLGRSNTVPSKRSPGLQAGRFQARGGASSPPVAPLTPVAKTGAAPSHPTVIEELSTPLESGDIPAQGSAAAAAAAAALGGASGETDAAARSQEQAVETPMDLLTPSRERNIHGLFQRSPTDSSDRRQPNKLKKKRLAGSGNPSAQSSSSSLPHSTTASPYVEVANPMEQAGPHASDEKAAETSNLPAGGAVSEQTPRAPQGPSSSLHPASAEATLQPKKSEPTSLHSSFNEGSDLDQVEELAPTTEAPEKDRKRRWRLSRRKEGRDEGEKEGSAGLASPRKVLGANLNAEGSSTSVGSAGKPARRSFTNESSDPTLMSADAPSSHDSGGREGRDESRGLTGWIKNKYREAKENAEQRRNKSPPADRTLSPGSGLFGGRGKSVEIKRPTEEETPETPKPPR